MPDMEALQKLPFLQHSTKVGWLIDFLRRTLRTNLNDKIVVVTQVRLDNCKGLLRQLTSMSSLWTCCKSYRLC